MNKKLLLLGAGGHCISVLDSIMSLNEYTDIRIIDRKELLGQQVLKYSISGTDEDLPKLREKGYNSACVTIGDNFLREKLVCLLEDLNFKLPSFIDPSAIVSPYSEIGEGVFIGKNAVINAGSSIGKGSVINTASIIEHNCTVEEFVHIAPGSVLCGDVSVKKNTHIGANSVVREQITIGPDSIIGMGSVVVTNISSKSIAYGNPCKER
ncbi:acetyltransferase [Planococcus sp. A6]|uniref:acetyltransferase n=1 Tax=Planococcus sp. A6 TaxID=2992760 RepID=UPI00237B4D07|nr:acetyltransferase [Planococcus sp. A6]MDE0582105.1 acetyltransferase [Planococcus sp. A6]